jgi:signal transduction histidine kinase
LGANDRLSSTKQAHKERRRVLLLFGFSILPPLILLTIVAAVAARTDEAALRYVEQERARQAGRKARQALHHAIRTAEEKVFAALEESHVAALTEPARVEQAFDAVRGAHPIAARFFILDSKGVPLWPAPDLPYRVRAGRPGLPEELIGASEGDYRRRAELQALYDRSMERQRAADLRSAVTGFRTVCASAAATPILVCRASYRLGRCLETLNQPDAAQRAYARAAGTPFPVRDEQGTPLRVEARLASAALAQRVGDSTLASKGAASLGQDLVAGVFRNDLREHEWLSAVERLDAQLGAAGREAEQQLLLEAKGRVSVRHEWLKTVEREAPTLLAEAMDAATGDVRPYLRLTRPPLALAYKLCSVIRDGGEDGQEQVVVGLQLELEALARDVISPACGSFSLEEEVSVTVSDHSGAVHAYARGAGGEPADRDPSATLALGPVPWSLRVTRSAAAMEAARRNQLLLYGGLILLTIVSAVAGAIATMRYVQRSLELAKMKSDFLSNMTHELKTPLTSIKMYGEMLATGRLRTKEKRKEYADHIVREGDRLHKLIENVLDFARQDEGLHEYVLAEADVADTVSEAIDLFRLSATMRGFDLFVELPPVGELPPVDLDRDAIVRSVLNLLSNAVKYSTDEKTIRVTVKREGHEQIMISVEDRGIGIDTEDLDLIFGRFYRAGDELTRGVSGAGLGLALIDQIVQAHMGEIHVESEKGQGSLFTMLLPIVEDYREQWPPPDHGDVSPDEVTDDGFRESTESTSQSGSRGGTTTAPAHTGPTDVGE